jgi:hypothetical protein
VKTGLLTGLLTGKQGWKCPVALLVTCCGSKSLKVILIDSDFRTYPVLNLRSETRSGPRPGPRDPGLQKPWIPGTELGPVQIPQIYSNRLKFSSVPCPQDARESLFPVTNYDTPVKDLVYKDLLTSTFTLASHERGIKTWCVPATYPECVYCGKRYRYERFNVECHMDPNIGKETDKERTVSPLYRAKNYYQHHVVLIENVSWNCRQKSVRSW